MGKGKTIVIAILLLIVLALGGTGYYLFTQSQQYKEQASQLQTEINSYKKTVLVTSRDIKAGDTITAEDVYSSQIVTTLETALYAANDCVGKIALTDISASTPVLKDMITNKVITQTTRLSEIDTVTLPITAQDGQTVDIRIRFPNGEDYIVLSRKKISNLFLESSVFTTELEEDEIITLSSAIIDTYTIAGTEMYLTTYIAPSVQEGLNETYLVRAETLDIITSSPNVLKQMKYTLNKQLRLEMEDRLKALSEEQLAAVVAGANLANTASGQVLIDVESGEADIDTSNIYLDESLRAEAEEVKESEEE